MNELIKEGKLRRLFEINIIDSIKTNNFNDDLLMDKFKEVWKKASNYLDKQEVLI